MKSSSLVVIHTSEKILLGLKKRGFGEGRWNGFGGKILEGETAEQSAVRELEEEAGIKAERLTARGELSFTFTDGTESWHMEIFRCEKYSGEPIETEEMKPQWFAFSEIPYQDMWANDRVWVPLFLEGKMIRGQVNFDAPGTQNILSHSIEGYV